MELASKINGYASVGINFRAHCVVHRSSVRSSAHAQTGRAESLPEVAYSEAGGVIEAKWYGLSPKLKRTVSRTREMTTGWIVGSESIEEARPWLPRRER